VAQLLRGVGAPSLEALKATLDGALGSLSCWVAALPTAEGWNWMGFVVPSNPNHPKILWNWSAVDCKLDNSNKSSSTQQPSFVQDQYHSHRVSSELKLSVLKQCFRAFPLWINRKTVQVRYSLLSSYSHLTMNLKLCTIRNDLVSLVRQCLGMHVVMIKNI